ncbi:MAG: preprotein translocase subunit YajC [Chitinophagia bacterium]|nr:preprotein translocase subunit YajC [Chitinophagia bacterium]
MLATLIPTLAQAAAPQAPQPPDQSLSMMVWMMFAFVLVYVLTIRPQQKKQKELEAQIKALKTGDKVVTSGGIHGVIANVKGEKETSLTLKIAENVRIEIEKSSIQTVLKS